MPNAWKKKASPLLLSFRGIFLLLFLLFFLLILIFFRPLSSQNPNPNPISLHIQISTLNLPTGLPLLPFDCAASPQAYPVLAARVEGFHYPFLYSLADFGSLPEKPHKNIVRMLKGKPFRRPEISLTIQEVLHGSKSTDGIVIDVGANVGMAAFAAAAAAMGFRVVAFEPVLENLQRICDGVFLNRFWDWVVIFEAAASDRLGNITLHKKCSYPNIIGCCHACSQENLMETFFNSQGQLSEPNFSKFLDKEIRSVDLCEEMLVDADIFGLSSLLHELMGEGSHRQLVTTMEFYHHSKFTPFVNEHFCEAIVIEYLPTGVFSDPFELQHLVSRGVFLSASVFGDTNLELPYALSNISVVEIHINVKSDAQKIVVQLPLHSRYAPLNSSGYINITISKPHLFIRCRPKISPTAACSWTLIDLGFSSENTVTWKIPCGNALHTRAVTIITFLSAIFCSFFIVLSTIYHSKRDKRKME